MELKGSTKLRKKIATKSEPTVTFSDSETKTAWGALNRWLKQNPGKRSRDFQREVIPLRDKLEEYLIKKKILVRGVK